MTPESKQACNRTNNARNMPYKGRSRVSVASAFCIAASVFDGVNGFTGGYSSHASTRPISELRVSTMETTTIISSNQELMNKQQNFPPDQIPSRGKRKGNVRPITAPADEEVSTSDDYSGDLPSPRILDSPGRPRSVRAAVSLANREAIGTRSKTRASPRDSFLSYNNDQLLSAPEEYSLAIKVQFLGKCEQVYAELSNDLLRLPTIEEWACACGFDTPASDFVESDVDRQIRPMAIDSTTGKNVGKTSKGKSKNRLGDFYNDTAERFPPVESDMKTRRKTKKSDPINRGTPHDFVRMLLECKESKQHLIQSNMRLVVSIASKYGNEGMSVQDLIQEGSLGLAKAAEKFDPSKGFKFATYASWWIQQAVFRALGRDSRTIRIPQYVHNILIRARKVRSILNQELGRSPTPEEVAVQLEMPVSKYNKLMRLTQSPVSLEIPRYQSNSKQNDDAKDISLGETIGVEENGSFECAELQVNLEMFRKDLQKVFDQELSEKEKLILNARYGLDNGGFTRTARAVGDELQQSVSRIQNLEAGAMRKLRRAQYLQELREHQEALAR